MLGNALDSKRILTEVGGGTSGLLQGSGRAVAASARVQVRQLSFSYHLQSSMPCFARDLLSQQSSLAVLLSIVLKLLGVKIRCPYLGRPMLQCQ